MSEKNIYNSRNKKEILAQILKDLPVYSVILFGLICKK